MKLPEPNYNIVSLINQYHESLAEPPRPHLGCSQLGHPCDRWLWLSFRWAVQPDFPGRMLRLFRRGKNEEDVVISDLRAIGIKLVKTIGQQHNVDFGCHVSGSLDGIIESGVPEAPKKKHILEIKTHSKKSFDSLERDGVEKSKPIHWVQMQVYMHGTSIDRALYVAVCKDDDRLYTERVRYDREIAEAYIRRGQAITLSDRMPDAIQNGGPSWYICQMCEANKFCWGVRLTKHVNCRTCAHSTAMKDSTWRCEMYKDTIPLDYQRQGCDAHVLHPDLVPWELCKSEYEWKAVYLIEGVKIINGAPDANVFSSKEIISSPLSCVKTQIEELPRKAREIFNAKVIT